MQTTTEVSTDTETTLDQNQVSTQFKSAKEILNVEVEEQIEKEDNCCIKVTFAYASEIPTVMLLLVESDEDEEPPLQEKNIGELQENCPDFQQIYEYLKDGTLPVEKNAAEITIAESKHFSLVDGILFHWFQRRCKKPKGEFNFVKQMHYRRFSERVHYCHTMTALQEVDI